MESEAEDEPLLDRFPLRRWLRQKAAGQRTLSRRTARALVDALDQWLTEWDVRRPTDMEDEE